MAIQKHAIYRSSLYYLCNLSVNLKLFQQKKFSIKNEAAINGFHSRCGLRPYAEQGSAENERPWAPTLSL